MMTPDLLFRPDTPLPDRTTLWHWLVQTTTADEASLLESLLPFAAASEAESAAMTRDTETLVRQVRARPDARHLVDTLLQEYSLETREGVLLMCLAEALMRIPDAETAEALIRDKLSEADWRRHLGHSQSALVNASTWGLLLTGRIIRLRERTGEPATLLGQLLAHLGEPVVRGALKKAMAIMAHQFVLGETLPKALQRRQPPPCTYTFDMLGEAALTHADAERYEAAYLSAIDAVAAANASRPEWAEGPLAASVSLKLSALYPRYEATHRTEVMAHMLPRLQKLIEHARSQNVAVTLDAEEQDRLELFLELFEALYRLPACRGWGQFGLVVQAYGKRALPTLAWLTALAREMGDVIPVRLVKGAYWDSEIKWAQQRGLDGYPVWTRKEATDVNYLACARYLLGSGTDGALYPQFATHNAHTVVAIRHLARQTGRAFEYQRLHGMGDALYRTVMAESGTPVRIYAPVGAHKDLLPYLVRRLLENGANTSFVHRLLDGDTPVEQLSRHPADALRAHASLANPAIPLPAALFHPERENSRGLNMHAQKDMHALRDAMAPFDATQWTAAPVIQGEARTDGPQRPVVAPWDLDHAVGTVTDATPEHARHALDTAASAWTHWHRTPVEQRAACLEKLADLLETHSGELMQLCVREAGKTLQDSIDEIREAVDFCRYYAVQARRLCQPQPLNGYTGEQNILYMEGRGVFVCISPWNFPLAIFMGQISAALVAGNAVIAKPAEQTSLIAARAHALMLEAGIPADVITLLPGEGASLGQALLSDPRVAGVAFTGSTETARVINRTLAEREGPLPTLIAETGGQNAMIVDSTALPEQVVRDVMQSAFASAGQRCSALRVLYLQEDIADTVMPMLKGAMATLNIGLPGRPDTDVGPVIDADAAHQLEAHIARMKQSARLLAETPRPQQLPRGHFVCPVAFEIDSIRSLEREVFGPVLHVVRYARADLDRVVDEINGTGYGLTLGIHSRNETFARELEQRIKVGNTYINRNQIGAVVGVQPFGGRGLSGTGPKAGGPHYLLRFMTERTCTTNTAAIGGNATLLALSEEDA
ncbi:MAG: bifunctional proline dehydrogenase/L-glutamate gamma-semialdehyde dehydrogenase PutA [Gammaproteobacteria bacterium]|nr:MAG: bifunctional proline dehydrogenase/L-glutamate gamma-semialdehyde dehydrogenase PutA [Gammaproteobacteria bacterium]